MMNYQKKSESVFVLLLIIRHTRDAPITEHHPHSSPSASIAYIMETAANTTDQLMSNFSQSKTTVPTKMPNIPSARTKNRPRSGTASA